MRKKENFDKKIFEKYLKNTCSQGELEILLEKLNDSSDQETEIWLKEIWNNNVRNNLKRNEAHDYFATYENFKTVLNTAKNRERFIRLKKRKNVILKFAAIVFLPIVIFSILKMVGNNTHDIYKETKNGERLSFHLDDGSNIDLNAASNLTIDKDYGIQKRELKLSGEAFFDVKHDTTCPFIVHCGKIDVRDIGTSFNIKSYEEDSYTSINVITGKVIVDIGTKHTLITPGQALVFNKNTNNYKIVNDQNQNSIGWTKQKLIFDNTPLPEVAKMLERWYGITVILKSDNKNDLTLSGTHQNESLASVAKVLKYTLKLDYIIQNDTLILK